jgi:UDP-glucuronate 4-epimerase
MHVLITGCAGFIGSHLCERLLADGHSVTGVDSLTDYYDPQRKLYNLKRSRDYSNFKFIQSPISSLRNSIIEDAEIVLHLAAQPGVRASWGADFQTYLKDNVSETQWLLERLRHSTSIRRLVYSSSSSVYGNIQAERVCEDHPKAPYSPYGVTKLAAEQLCAAYNENFGLPVVSLRLFTVFGPRQRPDMMFSKLISAALTGEEFTLYGDGTMRRDFTSVFDVVEGFTLAATERVESGVFNIAGGQVVSINEAIAVMEDILGATVPMKRVSESDGDVRRTGADISAARDHLGYAPGHSLRETLQAQVEWSERTLPAERSAVA